jgi:hypothetical protein
MIKGALTYFHIYTRIWVSHTTKQSLKLFVIKFDTAIFSWYNNNAILTPRFNLMAYFFIKGVLNITGTNTAAETISRLYSFLYLEFITWAKETGNWVQTLNATCIDFVSKEMVWKIVAYF